MSDPELPLDGALRDRLLTLADQAERHERGQLDAAAREQAIQRTLAQARAPGRVLRFPQRGVTGILAAAAALLLVIWRLAVVTPEAVRDVAPPTQRDATASTKAVAPTPACAMAAALDQARFVDGEAGVRTLTVGAHATALASADSVVRPGLLAPCTAQVTLDAGRVSVHARDLAGGSLEVRAGDVRVVVTGTVFAVERHGDSVRVALAEGHVSIQIGDGPAAGLDAGMQAVIEGGRLRREPLLADAQLALLAEHGVPAPAALRAQAAPAPEVDDAPDPPTGAARATPAALDADTVLSQADAERRAGKVAEARELYRRAATGSGMAAEAAWMRLCQLELETGRLDAAMQALASYERRFPHGTLGAEAAWTAVRVAQRRGDSVAARRAAERLVASHPRSPQAEAARRLLGAPTP